MFVRARENTWKKGTEIYYKLADTQVAEHVHRICEEMIQITCLLE